MNNFDELNGKNYLEHWGILGMHWGIRRFQNEDGSLTPEGRERYGVGEAIKKDINSGAANRNKNDNDSNRKKASKGNNIEEKVSSHNNSNQKQEQKNGTTFQNKDGSLNVLGRIRYGVTPKKNITGNVIGINDANSLSDEELRKMTRRYQAQADYYQARNNFIQQENYFKRNTTPERRPKQPSFIGNFAKKVFGEPMQDFLAKNVSYGLGYFGYNLLKGENPDIAAQYLKSVSGLDMHYKTKEEKEKEERQNRLDQIRLDNAEIELAINKDKRDRSEYDRERKERNDDLAYEKNKLELEKLRKSVNNFDNENRSKDVKAEANYRADISKISKNFAPKFSDFYDQNADQFIYSYFANLAENPLYEDVRFSTNNIPQNLRNKEDKYGFTYEELLDIYGLK